MEVWLDGRKSIEAFASLDSGIDRILFPQYSDSTRDYFIDGKVVALALKRNKLELVLSAICSVPAHIE